MSWLGLRHKGTEPLYSDEWNRVVDGLDVLYGYVADLERRMDCLEVAVEQYYLEVKRELESIEGKLERVEEEVSPPEYLDTYTLAVGTTPVPLSDVDRVVKKIHVKLPSWMLYICYIGDEARQEFVMEPGDEECLKIPNPRRVYVRSLGNVAIYVMLEY